MKTLILLVSVLLCSCGSGNECYDANSVARNFVTRRCSIIAGCQFCDCWNQNMYSNENGPGCYKGDFDRPDLMIYCYMDDMIQSCLNNDPACESGINGYVNEKCGL